MATTTVSSFAKALALGEIHEDLVFPYPIPTGEEAEKVRGLIQGFRDYAEENLDSQQIDESGEIPDQVYRDLGELGLMGLYVPEEYGGQGLSQTGYARVFEAIGQFDGSLTIGMGVHQSIGFKGIAMFGTDEQKERFLPDLAAGRKLAGFALTEPNAGSDAYNIESRAVQPVRRLVGAQRREALDRQRLPRRRADRVRARRGRRQGQAHRAHPREGDGGARPDRAALQDARPARQPACAPCASTTSACRRRTSSASPARASRSPCRS